MILKFGYAFLVAALFCLVVKASAVIPLVIGVGLIGYHYWRESSFTKVPTRRL